MPNIIVTNRKRDRLDDWREVFRDQAPRSQPLAVPGDRHLADEPPDATTDRSTNCEIIPDRVTDCRRRQWLHVNESNPKLLDLQSALAEMQRLREENVRQRCLLQEHAYRFRRRSPLPGFPSQRTHCQVLIFLS